MAEMMPDERYFLQFERLSPDESSLISGKSAENISHLH
jgi:hypothetical protein